jgi:hypothetical protein
MYTIKSHYILISEHIGEEWGILDIHQKCTSSRAARKFVWGCVGVRGGACRGSLKLSQKEKCSSQYTLL